MPLAPTPPNGRPSFMKCNITGLTTAPPADGDLGSGEQLLEAAVVVAVDDARVVGGLGGVGAVELTDRADDAGDEALLDVGVYERVVGGDAGLAGVEVLTPRDPPGRHVD